MQSERRILNCPALEDEEYSIKPRIRLENRFGESCSCDSPDNGKTKERVASCNPGFLRNISILKTGRSFRFGADKISKTFRSVKTSFGNLSQRFRLSSRRSHRLSEYSSTPIKTPSTPQKTKQILGRTPTKLYSPFGIETPIYAAEKSFGYYNPDTPEHGLSPKRRKSSVTKRWNLLVKKPRMLFD